MGVGARASGLGRRSPTSPYHRETAPAAVRIHSKSTKKPPTASCEGHESIQGSKNTTGRCIAPAPLDELLVAVEVLAVVAVVGRLELDLVVVLLRRLVRLALAGQSFDDALRLRRLGRVGVRVDEVDDLRAAHGVL